MKNWRLLTLICLTLSLQISAQTDTFPVWKDAIPGALKNTDYQEKQMVKDGELQKISHVVTPTLTIYMPDVSKANGTAVLILPGGGYGHLSMFKEGKKVAQWLNTLGITSFVLKYRLPSDLIMTDKSIGSLQDAQEAMRQIRRNAMKWKINPEKIGVMGFSAGGHLAATLSNHFDESIYTAKDAVSARPDFAVLVYPVISMKNSITHKGSQRNLLGENPAKQLIEQFSNELHVTASTPPTFIIHAGDDTSVPVENSLDYYAALKKQNVAAELHVYEKGGHGFGLGKENETDAWPEALAAWLQIHDYIPKKK